MDCAHEKTVFFSHYLKKKCGTIHFYFICSHCHMILERASPSSKLAAREAKQLKDICMTEYIEMNYKPEVVPNMCERDKNIELCWGEGGVCSVPSFVKIGDTNG